MKTWLRRGNLALITLFATSSGLFKVIGALTRRGTPDAWWEADNAVFAHLGLSITAVGVFGATQLLAGAAMVPSRSRKVAALAVAACNLFATAGLFAAGIQPFGVVSIVFVVMAVVAAIAG
mgnify:CR=1 FL=1